MPRAPGIRHASGDQRLVAHLAGALLRLGEERQRGAVLPLVLVDGPEIGRQDDGIVPVADLLRQPQPLEIVLEGFVVPSLDLLDVTQVVQGADDLRLVADLAPPGERLLEEEERFEVTAGSDDSLSKTLLDSKLRVNVVSKIG